MSERSEFLPDPERSAERRGPAARRAGRMGGPFFASFLWASKERRAPSGGATPESADAHHRLTTAQPFGRRSNADGFTLVELIVVIVLVGILAAVGGVFLVKPIEGYMALSRRAALVDAAEGALRRMQREVRQALPNSVRIKAEGGGNGTILEFIHVKAGGRYRVSAGGAVTGNPACRLQFSIADTSFTSVSDLDGTSLSASDRLVISNWTATGGAANAYLGDNITPAGTVLGISFNDAACGGEDRLTLAPGFRFPFPSDRQRFYVVDTPVAYLCNTTTGRLTRHSGHPITAAQASVDTAAELAALGAPGNLLADKVTACAMSYLSGTAERAGVVTLALTLTDPVSAESVRLLHQVHVENAP